MLQTVHVFETYKIRQFVAHLVTVPTSHTKFKNFVASDLRNKRITDTNSTISHNYHCQYHHTRTTDLSQINCTNIQYLILNISWDDGTVYRGLQYPQFGDFSISQIRWRQQGLPKIQQYTNLWRGSKSCKSPNTNIQTIITITSNITSLSQYHQHTVATITTTTIATTLPHDMGNFSLRFDIVQKRGSFARNQALPICFH